MQGFNDLLKTQMILGMGTTGRSSLVNIMALNFFDIATKTFPVWSNWTRVWCCNRRKMTSSMKTPRASITCERGMPSAAANQRQTTTPYQSRMDAVIPVSYTHLTLPTKRIV